MSNHPNGTRILKVSPKRPSTKAILAAANVIQHGGLVAFPTETVYGLGADALSPKAVRKIFEAKGRPADDPLIVHISDAAQLQELAKDIPKHALKLMKEFWPGPLTLIFEKSDQVPDIVTAGLNSVAIRMPSHKIANALIARADTPIAAPSANLFGSPSPTTAQHVISDLHDKIDMIIDGGEANIGVESTVLDVRKSPPTLLRPGGLPIEALRSCLGTIDVHPSVYGDRLSAADVAISPGMKYRHYAPRSPVYLIEDSTDMIRGKIQETVDRLRKDGKRVAVVVPVDFSYSADEVMVVGRDPTHIARNLFAILRQLDRKVDAIVIEGIGAGGLGLAIMNRLRRAATVDV
ncbi:MAG: threonylcarbamoyl-AMP synthase [Nitrososphaerota archaeon]|nr:threonylcarbamoyl-AMP synthase [Nitrososphaerota archaeon]